MAEMLLLAPENQLSDSFRGLLLERWESEGKSTKSFDQKVWRWLNADVKFLDSGRRRVHHHIRNWAFNTSANGDIWRKRKAEGYYSPTRKEETLPQFSTTV